MVKAIIGRCSPRVDNDIGAYVRSVGGSPAANSTQTEWLQCTFVGDIIAQ